MSPHRQVSNVSFLFTYLYVYISPRQFHCGYNLLLNKYMLSKQSLQVYFIYLNRSSSPFILPTILSHTFLLDGFYNMSILSYLQTLWWLSFLSNYSAEWQSIFNISQTITQYVVCRSKIISSPRFLSGKNPLRTNIGVPSANLPTRFTANTKTHFLAHSSLFLNWKAKLQWEI